MLETFKKVSNPLTIIAIFAGITEISGTLILPFVAAANQATYIWFLIFFPTLLVICFFLTLNLNHKVLYSPSDFREDESFLRASTPREQFLKIKNEVQAIQSDNKAIDGIYSLPSTPDDTKEFIDLYYQAEDLVLRELQAEYGRYVKRNVALDYYKTTVQFDAAITLKRALIAVEIKLVQHPTLNYALFDLIRNKAQTVDDAAKMSGEYWGGSVMLVIVATFSGEPLKEYTAKLEKALKELNIYTDLRIYQLDELRSKYPNAAQQDAAANP
ncbi:MAG TPA: hypothetical protein VIM61_04750 [Chthoniobacterales bacterium]